MGSVFRGHCENTETISFTKFALEIQSHSYADFDFGFIIGMGRVATILFAHRLGTCECPQISSSRLRDVLEGQVDDRSETMYQITALPEYSYYQR